MADTPEPSMTPSQPPEDFRWGISYLREDIQDLRLDIRGVHGRIDESNRSLGERIDETNRSLGDRIDETNRSLVERIDETNRSLGERIDDTNRSMNERFDETNRRMDSRFTWLMTTMIALAGIIVAAIKI